MKLPSRRTLLCCAALLSTLLMHSLGQAQGLLEKARRQGFVTIGFANEIPFAYADKGVLTGADAEVTREVLKRMGIKEMVGVLTEFQSLIPGLMAGRFDMTAGMYIRPARCAQILFTNPNLALGDSIVVKAGNPKGVLSYADVARRADFVLGYKAGATGILDNIRGAAIPPERVLTFPDDPAALAAVKAGRIDGFANTAIGNISLLGRLQDPALDRASPFQQPTVKGQPLLNFEGMGVRKADKEFRDEFNRHLAQFVGTKEHQALLAPFGITDAEIRPTIGQQADEICKTAS